MSGPPLPPMSSFTHRVERSPLLDRLGAFLPQLKAANEQLEQDIKENGAAKYSFEDTTGCENPIRLQLSIGVLEPQKIDHQPTQTAEQAAINPHNLAILPSELDEQKKQQGQVDIKLPWELASTQTNSTDDDLAAHQSMVTLVEEEYNDQDDDQEEEVQSGSIKKPLKKLRQSTNTNRTMTDPNTAMGDSDLQPLLGSPKRTEEMALEQDSIRLGSHLFTDEDPVMTAAEALAVLRGLGYEAVGDISLATPYHAADEIDTTMGNDDDDDAEIANKPKVMVEEVHTNL